MDGSRARLDRLSLAKVPTLARKRLERPSQEGLLSLPWALALGLGWPIAFQIAKWMEPAPAHPASHTPMIVELGAVVFTWALMGTMVAAALRHRGAAIGGIGAGGILFAFSLACPMSGHHAYGLWWFGQLAIVATMLAVSVAAFRATWPRSVT